jgi:Tannase and feruloyl esterase
MRRTLLLVAAAIVPLTAVALAPTAGAAPPRTTTTCSPPNVAAPPGARVEAVTTAANAGGTVTVPDQPPLIAGGTVTGVPAWCDVVVTLTHPGAGDHVTVKVSLPSDPTRWTGRLQATGGSAYLAGNLHGVELIRALANGYVAATTDAGVTQDPGNATWGLKADGTVDSGLLTDFASRSVHDMTVVAKAVTNTFYGTPVTYAYWNGCSTGGRQGYEEAQDFPTDYDGILAAAPAINWDRFAIATLWSQAVFHEEHVSPTPCEMAAFDTAAVKACDTIDGVRDGIIDNPQACHWNPRKLIGTRVVCDDGTHTISAAEADAVGKIWAGPTAASGRKLWYGPNIGADFTFLAAAGSPFTVAASWAKYFVAKNPALDTTQLTYRGFGKLFASSQRQYNRVIGTDDPNLFRFRNAGGKLLSWHGQADQLVPTLGTVDYRQRVERLMGGTAKVDDFYRLFLLPGVTHCGGGPGPQATDPLRALVTWVEQDRAPATLATASADGTVTRNACPYPRIARYLGHGDPAEAGSYRCA